MRVQRQTSRRADFSACGCVLIVSSLVLFVLAAALIAAPDFSTVLMRIIGFEPIDDKLALNSASDRQTIINGVKASAIAFLVEGYGTLELSAAALQSVLVGRDATGSQILQVMLGAEDIDNLCRTYTPYCSDVGKRIRRAAIRFNENQLVLEGELYINLLNRWQAIELSPELGGGAAIKIDSIAINGVRYKIPANDLGGLIQEAVATVNQILRQFSARHGGNTYQLSAIDVIDNRLVATFR